MVCIYIFNSTFGTTFGTRKLFSKNNTHAGSLVNTTLPAYYRYPFPLPNPQSSAQNPFRAEDFCSIIIEAQILETQKPPKAHRSPRDVLQWSPNLFYTCADSSKWGLFGRCARSAFRRTTSGRITCR